MKTWRQVLLNLHAMHETRKSMAHSSLYHAQYVDWCVELNTQLKAQTGRDYIEFSPEEIEQVRFDNILGLQEES